jgi:hypothetical protein
MMVGKLMCDFGRMVLVCDWTGLENTVVLLRKIEVVRRVGRCIGLSGDYSIYVGGLSLSRIEIGIHLTRDDQSSLLVVEGVDILVVVAVVAGVVRMLLLGG